MRKIIIDGKNVDSLVPASLPMLIHGAEGSGASLYTICLAATWTSQGFDVLFLCGYPMAEQEFTKELEGKQSTAKFYTQDKLAKFIAAIDTGISSQTIVFIKNIELFDENLFNKIKYIQNIIISGDVDKTIFKDKLLKNKFTTKIYFSPLPGQELPQMAKYHGYLVSDNYSGVTSV